ncbi:MAG: 2-C-methyl-D-erythritol 2,4-cyclodiphosphate synthase [Proteobacteria bacterium]|nr:2-C-methyl-D-erythritol 2,4-cyclodiphosphate synthase [Pseudomonadota bacterium]
MRIGIGYDVHRLIAGRRLILGGVDIPHEKGLLGHSDADVLVHSIMDAMLGALALGDIGKHFPDTDTSYKNADSIELLGKVNNLIQTQGYSVVNIDSVIMAEKPKLLSFIERMRQKIAECLECDISYISIKATTTEKLGFVGKEEGIAAQAVVLVNKKL